MTGWPDIGIATGKFLLPAGTGTLSAWPVVACDQFTSQPQYWDHVEAIVGARPSSLHLVLPEAFLDDHTTREKAILETMREYLKRGIINQATDGMVLTARTTPSGTRLGLVLCVDLEQYDYGSGSASLVRATEGTVESRIPPRLRIRREAPIELSHIMVLADDPGKSIIEPVYALRSGLRLLYDLDLMQGGGHLSGWAVEDNALISAIVNAIRALKSNQPEGAPLLAVGDGNHSLAAALAHYLQVKASLPGTETADHPARYAMAELTNLQDAALRFEPIHRILYNTDCATVLRLLQDFGAAETKGQPDITLLSAERDIPLALTRPLHLLAVGTVQKILDGWTNENAVTVDYIHGEGPLRELVSLNKAVGIVLPAMNKSLLFPAVAAFGPLPRKTFSMGEAHEKRYYMEARRITQ
jgi:hypothetical protein